MPSRRTTPRLDQEIPVGPDHLGGSRENVTALGRIMKGRLRRALFIAALGATAIVRGAAATPFGQISGRYAHGVTRISFLPSAGLSCV